MQLRPHHLLCISFFEGKGYSDSFTKNMVKIVDFLNSNQQEEITLCLSPDKICSRCPNLKNNVCITNEKVVSYDKKVLEYCGFDLNKSYIYNFLNESVKNKIIQKDLLKEICGDCKWFYICG